MARVKAKDLGYYEHRMVRAGEIFDMKEVDKNGFYLDSKGKHKLFPVYGNDGLVRKDEKGQELHEPRKCKWVDSVNSEAGKPLDPKEVAAVLSGKQPGVAPGASQESAQE